MLNGLFAYATGDKYWYKDNLLHREDGPAFESSSGKKEWYYKDILVGYGDKPDPALWKRVTSVEINGGPLLNGCIVDPWGTKYWYKDDQHHRLNGPAVEWVCGTTHWLLDGDFLGANVDGFWNLWARLTREQRGSPTLLKYLPR